MSNTEGWLLILLIATVIGFLAMAAECFRINNDWYEIAQEQNKDWLDTIIRNTEEWAKECERLAKKCDELQAKVNELERGKTE